MDSCWCFEIRHVQNDLEYIGVKYRLNLENILLQFHPCWFLTHWFFFLFQVGESHQVDRFQIQNQTAVNDPVVGPVSHTTSLGLAWTRQRDTRWLRFFRHCTVAEQWIYNYKTVKWLADLVIETITVFWWSRLTFCFVYVTWLLFQQQCLLGI